MCLFVSCQMFVIFWLPVLLVCVCQSVVCKFVHNCALVGHTVDVGVILKEGMCMCLRNVRCYLLNWIMLNGFDWLEMQNAGVRNITQL